MVALLAFFSCLSFVFYFRLPGLHLKHLSTYIKIEIFSGCCCSPFYGVLRFFIGDGSVWSVFGQQSAAQPAHRGPQTLRAVLQTRTSSEKPPKPHGSRKNHPRTGEWRQLGSPPAPGSCGLPVSEQERVSRTSQCVAHWSAHACCRNGARAAALALLGATISHPRCSALAWWQLSQRVETYSYLCTPLTERTDFSLDLRF